MLPFKDYWNDQNLIETLKEGRVVVMPTDTIYGIVGQVLNQKTVERIYQIRKRNPNKPCIILISSFLELEKFSIHLTIEQENKLKEFSDRPTSIILECLNDKLSYLHRGTNSLAFRLPQEEGLINLLKNTGPLIAPSANVEGLPSAKNIQEAKNYFGPEVDVYVDAGEIVAHASRVVKIDSLGEVEVIRD
jgi:L-threonylcarbamoyladenylate synthase